MVIFPSESGSFINEHQSVGVDILAQKKIEKRCPKIQYKQCLFQKEIEYVEFNGTIRNYQIENSLSIGDFDMKIINWEIKYSQRGQDVRNRAKTKNIYK